MSTTTGIVWVKTPDELVRAYEKYGERVVIAVRGMAEKFAHLIQDEARQTAPWQDRTGHARSGLFGEVDVERAAGDAVVIYLSHGHTIDYGKWLELAHGGRYAAIMPVIERNLPLLERMLKEYVDNLDLR